MPRGTRREFLKFTGLGAAGVAASKLQLAAAERPKDLPQHRGLALPGIHAYADHQSISVGQTIAFHVSSSVRYDLSVCRLGLKIDDPAGDLVLHEFPQSAPHVQPIYPGSYVRIDKPIREKLKALTLECWVRPWKVDAAAGLICQFDSRTGTGFGIVLNPSAGVSFLLGNGKDSATAAALKPKRWHHVVGTWDGKEKALWLDGQLAGKWAFSRAIDTGGSILRLGAFGESHFLDGDLAMPVIYDKALTEAEVKARFKDQALTVPRDRSVLGCWPLAEERGDVVKDGSRHRRHGHIVNHGTWMIGGPSFDPNVPRFGNYDPRKDPQRGHALRLASDDLYDCRWTATHKFRVPAEARSGIYVGRIKYEWEGKPCLYHVTFIVRKAASKKKAPILLLAASNTWLAYNAAAFPAPKAGIQHVCGTSGMTNSAGDPPAFSFYRGHVAGQGTYQVGLKTPWPSADPYLLYGGPTKYSHLMRADRFAQVWLEEAGYQYDIISDLDLHRDPKILSDYPVFIINGHSEYWSIPMYEGLRKYLGQGGNVIVLSGNSVFWRVSFNEDCSILECRKVDAPGDQVPPSRRGECWHSQDGLRGGLLRECGYPGWKLIGLETLGWNNQSNPEQFGPYIVERPDHFLFQKPMPCGLKKGDAVGQGPKGALPRGNGHEIDVRLSTLAELQQDPLPAGATMPADPEGITRIANGIIPWSKGGAAFDYFFRSVKPKTDQGGEMIYWERPEGGKVFNAGSIGAGWALAADPKFQRLMKNVLSHFGVES